MRWRTIDVHTDQTAGQEKNWTFPFRAGPQRISAPASYKSITTKTSYRNTNKRDKIDQKEEFSKKGKTVTHCVGDFVLCKAVAEGFSAAKNRFSFLLSSDSKNWAFGLLVEERAPCSLTSMLCKPAEGELIKKYTFLVLCLEVCNNVSFKFWEI